MTPQQEKAKELVDKMYKSNPSFYFTWEMAKECAIIACDELMNALPSVYLTDDEEIHNGHYQYWQQVKQEIENL